MNAAEIKLLVTNLSRSTTECHIASLFGSFGRVSRVRVQRSRATGRSRGRASLALEPSAEFQAETGLEGLFLDGKRLKVEAMGSAEGAGIVRAGSEPFRSRRLLY